VAPGSRFDKPAANEETAYHLILLARNMEGYKNLMWLVSEGYQKGFYRKPRIDKEVIEQLRYAKEMLELNWFDLPVESTVLGKSVGELHIRRTTGASVVGIVRPDGFIPNPGADFVFASGDIVAVIGNGEAREAFGNLIARP